MLNTGHAYDALMDITARPKTVFVRGEGACLWDDTGKRYLDFIQGWAVNCLGHAPAIVADALAAQARLLITPSPAYYNDASLKLAKALVDVSAFDQVFFANSGAESNEGAIKLARKYGALHRNGGFEIITFEGGFHGRTLATMSASGKKAFEPLFEPKVPGFRKARLNDLASVEALINQNTVAVMLEPVQGEAGVWPATDQFLRDLRALTKERGLLLIVDEIQTGMGRTGRFLAVEHWNVEPDMVLLSKALSGGHVPVGALLTRKSIFDKIFNQMDRAVVHGSTFAKNDLAMAAGIATLEVLEAEKLIEAAAKRGAELRLALTRLVPGYELMKEVRGKGLMIGVEFGPPKSLRLRASWNVLEAASKGLFCQLITVPLFKDHKILTQVSGHGSHTIKLLPSLTITEEDCRWIETAFDTVVASSHKVPGAIWSLGKTLVDNAVRRSA